MPPSSSNCCVERPSRVMGSPSAAGKDLAGPPGRIPSLSRRSSWSREAKRLADSTHHGPRVPLKVAASGSRLAGHARTLPRGLGPQPQEFPGLRSYSRSRRRSSLPGRPRRTGFPRPRRAPIGPRSPHAEAGRARPMGPGCILLPSQAQEGPGRQQGAANDASFHGALQRRPHSLRTVQQEMTA